MNWSGWGKRPLKLEVQFYLGGCIQVWEKMGMFPTHSTGFIRHLALLLISFTLVTTSPTLLLPLHVQNSPKRRFIYSTSFLTYPSQIKLISSFSPYAAPKIYFFCSLPHLSSWPRPPSRWSYQKLWSQLWLSSFSYISIAMELKCKRKKRLSFQNISRI